MATQPLQPLSSLPVSYVAAFSGGPVRATAIAFIVLQTVFVGLRFWSKAIGGVLRGHDDWLIILGLIFCIGLDVCALLSVDIAGVGTHLVVVLETAPNKLVELSRFLLILPLVYGIGVVFTKLSILFFYSRIFVLGWTRKANYATMVFVVVPTLATIPPLFLQCRPLEFLWNKSTQGHCFNIIALDRYALIPQTISDLIMLLLPLPTIWSLQSPIRTKIGITTTFLTASLGMIASIIRLVIFFNHNQFEDNTWNVVNMWIWMTIEPGCYLIAACLVCMRPLFNRMTGHNVEGTSSQSNLLFNFKSLRSLFESSRNTSVVSPGSAVYPLEDVHDKSSSKQRIKVETELRQIEDEEKLVDGWMASRRN